MRRLLAGGFENRLAELPHPRVVHLAVARLAVMQFVLIEHLRQKLRFGKRRTGTGRHREAPGLVNQGSSHALGGVGRCGLLVD